MIPDINPKLTPEESETVWQHYYRNIKHRRTEEYNLVKTQMLQDQHTAETPIFVSFECSSNNEVFIHELKKQLTENYTITKTDTDTLGYTKILGTTAPDSFEYSFSELLE